jgi:hypothetical protein
LINENYSKGSNPDTIPKFELTIENINNKPNESNEEWFGFLVGVFNGNQY